MNLVIRRLEKADLAAAAGLQRACFPPPFPEDHLWQADHLASHLDVFPEGQFVAVLEGRVVGSATSMQISTEVWQARPTFDDLIGDFHLAGHDPAGRMLFAVDISVHPEARNRGVARGLYEARKTLIHDLGLDGLTAYCRLPGCQASGLPPQDYAEEVVAGRLTDATLTPVLRLGMDFVGVRELAWPDPESRDAAGVVQWKP
ncbi:MAG: GNAT family N-acetyltransferase [Fimbriimonadaceae bacterium]|nr:GNAT family N-acetyltransferase [Fimbriimonadaceae bacterium]